METKSILPAMWEVPAIFRRRIGSSVGRQRAMSSDDHVLLAVHAPPMPDHDDREGIFFWRHPDGSWRSTEQGAGIAGLATLLDRYHQAIDASDDAVERADNAEDYFLAIEQLSPLLRAATHLHQVLQNARKMLPDDREILDLRDRAYQIERTASLAYEGAKHALDFAVARRAEEQAAASHRMGVAAHRLNVMASFFFPLATLSAMFGVNMKHGWEETPPAWPFSILIAIGLASGMALTAYVTRGGKFGK